MPRHGNVCDSSSRGHRASASAGGGRRSSARELAGARRGRPALALHAVHQGTRQVSQRIHDVVCLLRYSRRIPMHSSTHFFIEEWVASGRSVSTSRRRTARRRARRRRCGARCAGCARARCTSSGCAPPTRPASARPAAPPPPRPPPRVRHLSQHLLASY